MTTLPAWQNFYVVVGSSAGALIGLQFVVMSLMANRPTSAASADAGAAFATPNIIHFGAVLLLAGIMTAPWEGMTVPAILWGILGLTGLVYAVVVIRRMRRQTSYHPEFEDWLCHAVLPLAAYFTLAASSYAARFRSREALIALGAAVLLLLFTGIHNAWDAVTYHVFVKRADSPESSPN